MIISWSIIWGVLKEQTTNVICVSYFNHHHRRSMVIPDSLRCRKYNPGERQIWKSSILLSLLRAPQTYRHKMWGRGEAHSIARHHTTYAHYLLFSIVTIFTWILETDSRGDFIIFIMLVLVVWWYFIYSFLTLPPIVIHKSQSYLPLSPLTCTFLVLWQPQRRGGTTDGGHFKILRRR